ncbi:importin-11-like [Eriocheir sinensis]|uniref:importin-11-like n=1 Tax=Eriocheir sinensis TaxID=95602 RepID=UPI0021C79B76|nr:importin-11-like [Eriocheir sinensis]
MSGGKELVLETLRRATSQEAEVLKPAEQQLQQWETEPGFYSTLVEIFSEYSLEVNVRFLAVLYFKNGVDRYWRKTAPNAILEEEKTQIRCGLLHNLREPVSQVATQLAVLIAKIARVDCPREWPNLLPSLFEAVKSNDDIVRHRSLLTLHHVIKQLASKRLLADRRTFQELTNQMFSFLLELWRMQTEAFLSAGGQDMERTAPSLELSHLALKILRKLIIHGFKKPEESEDAILFLKSIFDQVKVMLTFRKQNESNDHIKLISEKYIVLLTKVLRDMLEDFPFSYVQFIKLTLELAVFYIFTPNGDGLIFERFTVQCLNLIKAILLCPEYKPCKVVEETKNPQTLEAFRIKSSFFTTSVLAGMCHKLISHHFLLTPEDLEVWDSDPEGFCMEVEGGESWKYSLRPCTETLFVALFHEYRNALTPVLMEMVQSSHNPVSPSDFMGILQKDAVYNAVGLAAFELFDDIDFDQWFTTFLINELKVKDSNYRIIRRRVIWLIGQWTRVKFSPEHRPTLYEACIHLLAAEEDFVVRLSAAMTLKHSVDDFEFDPEQFMPYLPTIFGLLFNLLKEAHECDTKMQVLHVMSFMIEVVGVGIQPHVAPLAQYLPSLWSESADHNMLRCAILTTLVHMVTGLMQESERLHDFLINIIRVSTDVGEDCHVYLLEDGLLLWLTTLENTAHPHDALLHLYDNMMPLMELSSENLRLCLQITTAYTLLCPQQFLAKYGTRLIETFRSMMADLKNEAIVLVLRAVEMILRVLPSEGAALIQPLLPGMVKIVAEGDQYPNVMSMYLSVVARLVLYAEPIFTWIVNQAASNESTTPEDMLEHITSIWADKLALVSPEERRKLCALGLAHLCGSGWPPVMKVWPAAITAIVEVVYDVTMEDSDQDKLVINGGRMGSPEPYELETEHVLRRQTVAQRDPVHTTSLRVFLGQQMKRLQESTNPATIMTLAQDLEENCRKVLEEVTVQ